MPRTPTAAPDPAVPADGTDDRVDAREASVPVPAHRDRPAGAGSAHQEPEYLIRGTGCTGGHERGHELDTGRLGRVPTRKGTRIGLFLVLWCVIGVGLVVDLRWLSFGLQLLAAWLILAAIVVRRSGHQGHCWRTRTWRHAWGGLAPTAKDPASTAGA
jgi:hypothetical protein